MMYWRGFAAVDIRKLILIVGNYTKLSQKQDSRLVFLQRNVDNCRKIQDGAVSEAVGFFACSLNTIFENGTRKTV